MSPAKHRVTPCPECQGTRARAKVHEDMRWSNDSLYSSAHRFNALICTKCGHMTLYAIQFQDLKQAQNQQAKPKADKR